MALMPALARLFGAGAEIGVLAIGLAVHESAHIAAARLCRVRVDELRLMPFGGAMELGNLYALPPGRLFAVAAAGPAANLAMVWLGAALAHWRAISPGTALDMLHVNLLLALFNLLPALPLDGGRMLYALTARRLGRARAANLGIVLGRAVAALLIAGMIAGRIAHGHYNLTAFMASVFILTSHPGERRALADMHVSSMLNAMRPAGAPVPLGLWGVDRDCPAHIALRCAEPDRAAMYAVYAKDEIEGVVDERGLLELLLINAQARVGDALPHRPAARTAG